MINVSVIVPVYNVELYVNRCVDSIINQKFKNFEIILIDDGSTDNSGKICDEYAQKYDIIKVFHKKNGGLSSARNCGIDRAKGEYIAFIDSDDFIHHDMLSTLYNNIIKYNTDISMCDFLKVSDEKTNCILDIIKDETTIILSGEEAQYELYKENPVEFVVAWNKLYRKKIFKDLRYEEGRIYEDEFIIHKIFNKIKSIVYVHSRYYYYYIRDNSIVNSKFNIKNLDATYALKDRADFYHKIGLEKLSEIADYNYVRRFFYDYYKAKNELKDCKKNLFKLKKDFTVRINRLLHNSRYSNKEKLAWMIFIISPTIYEKYIHN